MSEKNFKFDSFQSQESVTRYLRELTEGFEKGELELAYKGEVLRFSPRGLVAFALEAKSKGDSRKLTIKLRWKEGGAAVEDKGDQLVMKAGE